MVIDYEAAWTELAEYVAQRTQHGREPLMVEMAQIASRHRVEAGELPRVLRLYGVEVARAASTDIYPSEGEDLAVGLVSAGDLPSRATMTGGHDGRRTRAAAGRT